MSAKALTTLSQQLPICFYCKKNGHIVKNCRKLEAKLQREAQQEADYPPLCQLSGESKRTTSIRTFQKSFKQREQERNTQGVDYSQRHVERMMDKWGPRWFWKVQGTREDCPDAMKIRDELEAQREAAKENSEQVRQFELKDGEDMHEAYQEWNESCAPGISKWIDEEAEDKRIHEAWKEREAIRLVKRPNKKVLFSFDDCIKKR
jgi:hypothetical protein